MASLAIVKVCKKFQLRARFNSGDGNNNSGTGWFLDDARIYGK